MKSFKQHSIEEGVKEDCIEKFKRVLFGEFRNKESDTQKESKIFDKIVSFIQDNSHSKTVVDAFKELEGCKEFYKEELVPNAKVIYRGSQLSRAAAKKLKIIGKKSSYYIAETTYKPHKEIQSWTASFKVAKSFKGEYGPKGGRNTIQVIYEMDITKRDFIMNSKFMNKIASDSNVHSEDEIVRINKSPVKVIVYIHKKDYQRAGFDMPDCGW